MLTSAFAAVLAAATAATPTGRPPVGPLAREDPKVYEFTFEVIVSTVPIHVGADPQPVEPLNPFHQPRTDRHPRGIIDLVDSEIWMPVALQSTFHAVDPDSLDGSLWLGNREVANLHEHTRLEADGVHRTHRAIIPIERFRGSELRWNVRYRAMTYSSRIDDAAAAQIPWPREWPDEVADGLKPQRYIESDDPIFKQTVDRVSDGRLRMVPPYVAAKELVRYTINELPVTGDGLDYGRMQTLHGLELFGAKLAAEKQLGSPHDLVCACVAMLRAAGIPSRPVIGVYEDATDRDREKLISWAEFYLPDCGWIPFDPNEMRGKGIRHRDVRDPWPEFGTMRDLNERIPLGYAFLPQRSAPTPERPAVWGWEPTPSRPPHAEQRISLSMVSRGSPPTSTQ
jgi:transglutaminase-like putative cysteine protease